MKTIYSIQYLRAIAALAVVASHASASMLRGQAGVDLFFVISGFIMWTVTAKPTPVSAFLWNRLVRIVPLYFLATLLMGLHQHASAGDIIKSVLFIPYFGEDGFVWPVLVQGWTLNYEVFFYGLIALVLGLPRRAGLYALAATMGALSLAHVWADPASPAWLTYTNPLNLEFLAGVGLAELHLRSMLPGRSAALVFIVLGLGIFLAVPLHGLPGTWRFAVWGVPGLLVVAGAVCLEARGWVGRNALLLGLGNASFSIYLSYSFILKAVLLAVPDSPLPVRIAAVVVSAAVLGLLVCLLIEKPVINVLRGRMPFSPGPVAARARAP